MNVCGRVNRPQPPQGPRWRAVTRVDIRASGVHITADDSTQAEPQNSHCATSETKDYLDRLALAGMDAGGICGDLRRGEILAHLSDRAE